MMFNYNFLIKNLMPNQTIISMHQNYPFGSCPVPRQQNHEVIVRKKINTGNKHQLISKAKHFKKLKVPNSIHIISILQDHESIQIYYEYVPVKFEKWMKSMSDFLSDNLLKQLYMLTTFLAENKITTSFNPQQLGLDKHYHIKYYLDLQNTFYNQFQNPSTLKQKYYRQINLFCKSFHSQKDKTHHNPLFSSLNSFKTQPSQITSYPIRSLSKNFDRALSFGSLQSDTLSLINRTQTTDHEVPQNTEKAKISLPKKQIEIKSFNQKLQSIQQKLQIVKEKGPKVFLKSSSFQKRTSLNDISIKKAANLKQLVESSKQKEQISMQKLGISRQKEENNEEKVKRGCQSVTDPYEGNSFFFRPQTKRNKSQRFKSQKNSESPIEYMDLIKSTSAYMQDFLNVLEDSSESQGNVSAEDQKHEIQQLRESEQAKSLMKTQQSQNESDNQQKKWRLRFNTAIENSKKLIDRMRSPPKPTDSRMERRQYGGFFY